MTHSNTDKIILNTLNLLLKVVFFYLLRCGFSSNCVKGTLHFKNILKVFCNTFF